MKKMRIPLLIAWGVAVLGIVFGSFFDYQISSAIASADNAFALTLSAIIPTLGFAGVAVMGGGFIALAVKGKYHIALKVLLLVLAACCLGVSIYYSGGEYFGINGFYNESIKFVGYLIVIIPEVAAMVGGYFLFKDCQNEKMWIIFVIIVGLLLLVLLLIIPTIKDNMRRPRYRIIAEYGVDNIRFHNWWEPCTNYKEIMETLGITKSDHFKSFPSGHTAEASILLVAATFFPMAHEKLRKIQLPLFIGSCLIVLIVAVARIMAAAHFLSDVSWGAGITLTVLVIANEVVMRIKPLHIEEE